MKRCFTLIEAMAGTLLVALLGVALAHSLVVVRHASHGASRAFAISCRTLVTAGTLAEGHAFTATSHRPDGATIEEASSSLSARAAPLSRQADRWGCVWIVADIDGVGTARWVATREGASR